MEWDFIAAKKKKNIKKRKSIKYALYREQIHGKFTIFIFKASNFVFFFSLLQIFFRDAL